MKAGGIRPAMSLHPNCRLVINLGDRPFVADKMATKVPARGFMYKSPITLPDGEVAYPVLLACKLESLAGGEDAGECLSVKISGLKYFNDQVDVNNALPLYFKADSHPLSCGAFTSATLSEAINCPKQCIPRSWCWQIFNSIVQKLLGLL